MHVTSSDLPAGRLPALAIAAGLGAVAGLAGVTAMTLGEKLEQAVASRPDSYVPARALLTLLGRRPGDSERPLGWNYAMHVGTAAGVGALRGVWSAVGIRGVRATATHAVVRLAVDQTIENVTGVGAPPHTWPRSEQAIDFLHKGVYSLVTGVLADRLIPPHLQSARGRQSH
jgi:hypothetical protein